MALAARSAGRAARDPRRSAARSRRDRRDARRRRASAARLVHAGPQERATLTVGLHPDRIGPESYSERWAERLRGRGVDVRWLDLRASDALDQVKGCAGVMWRWAHTPADKQVAPAILRVIEHELGMPVYPDTRTAWHFDDKLAQLPLLRALGAPMPRTWAFFDRADALAWSAIASYPVVFKLAVGAGSSNVIRVDSAHEARRLIERAWGRGIFPGSLHPAASPPGARRRARALAGRAWRALGYVARGDYPPLPSPQWRPERGYAYFQAFVPGNAFDTRISVVGERAFGYRRMNRPHDFRASGSGTFDPDPRAIDRRCVEIAFALSRAGGFQSMAYDFLALDGRPVVLELSYGFVDWMVHDCPGHWTPDGGWVDGPMWPEDAQVDDFLDRLHAAAR